MSHSSDLDLDVTVERVRFPWKTVVLIAGAIATVLLSSKSANLAADGELATVKTRMSVVETQQHNDTVHRDRIQQQLDRLEEKVDRLLERGR